MDGADGDVGDDDDANEETILGVPALLVNDGEHKEDGDQRAEHDVEKRERVLANNLAVPSLVDLVDIGETTRDAIGDLGRGETDELGSCFGRGGLERRSRGGVGRWGIGCRCGGEDALSDLGFGGGGIDGRLGRWGRDRHGVARRGVLVGYGGGRIDGWGKRNHRRRDAVERRLTFLEGSKIERLLVVLHAVESIAERRDGRIQAHS